MTIQCYCIHEEYNDIIQIYNVFGNYNIFLGRPLCNTLHRTLKVYTFIVRLTDIESSNKIVLSKTKIIRLILN